MVAEQEADVLADIPRSGWSPTQSTFPEITPDQPDVAYNVTPQPTRSWASIANDYADIYSDEALSTPAMPPPQSYYSASSGPRETLGNLASGIGQVLEAPVGAVGGFLSGSNPRESVQRAVEGFANPNFSDFRDIGFVRNLPDEDVVGSLSPRDVAGGVSGLALDPTNLLPIGAAGAGIKFLGRHGDEAIEGVARAADDLADPIAKLTTLIKAAKPVREQSEVLKSQELSRRVARAASAMERGSGEEAFMAAKSQLSGALPRAQFDAPRPELTAEDVAGLFDRVRHFPTFRPLEKIATSDALTTALAGQIPTRSQLANLETVFGADLVEALLEKRSFGDKAWETFVDALNIPRSLVTSIDLSAPFRQGAMMIGHPREFAGSLTPMVKAFTRESYARAVDEAIAASPYASIKQDAGLYIAPLNRKSAALGEHEEAFMSRLIQRGPVKGSQQAYVTFLNKLRSDVFDNWWGKLDPEHQTPENAQRYAAFINAATGRGSLPRALNNLQPLLNATLFSPRYFVSRLQANGMGIAAIADVGKGIITPGSVDVVSKQIAGDYLKFIGTVGTVMGLAGMAGAKIEMDSDSSDWLKIRVGDTRYDVLAGNQQILRNTSNLLSGERKSPTTGQTKKVGRNDVILGFIRSKLAPIPSLLWDIGAGSTILGEEVSPSADTLKTQAWNRLVPFVIQDIKRGYDQEGEMGAIKATPAIFGVGAQSFDAPGTSSGSPARPSRPSRPTRPSRPQRPQR